MNDELEPEDVNINAREFETFQTDVHHFRNLEDKIKELDTKIKPLIEKQTVFKRELKDIKGNLCYFMGKNNVGACNLPQNSGTLKYAKRTTKAPVTQKVIKTEFEKFFISLKGNSDSGGNSDEILTEDVFFKLSSSEKAEELFKFIYTTNRSVKVTETLRKVKAKA